MSWEFPLTFIEIPKMLKGKNVIFMADASQPRIVYVLIFPFNDE